MKEFLESTLFSVEGFSLKTITVLKLVIFFAAVFIFLFILRKFIYRAKKFDEGKKYAIYNLFRYFTLVIALVLGLQILGFNLSVLMAGSAALLVGVGLGLQNLFSDFVSGIIILVDSSIKVGDIVEINGLVCEVQEINLRTTTVLTREDKYMILPNTEITRNYLINWTHSTVTSRFEVTVGVDYSSDVNLVMNVLKQAVDQQKGVLMHPKPFIRFTDFGESSLNFSVLFWCDDVFRVESLKSELRVKIFELFKANKITIPFPQRDIHIKSK